MLVGCEANYSISIGDNKIKEELIFNSKALSNSEKEKLFNTNLGIHYYENYDIYSEINSPEKKYYKKEKIDNGKNISINYEFTNDEYANSAIIKNCFDKYIFWSSDADREIKATGFNCFKKYLHLDLVNINIKIDSQIISTNGKTKDNINYSWQITKENAENFELNFKFPSEPKEIGIPIETVEEIGSRAEGETVEIIFKNEKDQETYEHDIKNNDLKDNAVSSKQTVEKIKTDSFIVLYVLLGLIIFGSIIGFIVYIINKKNNKL